MAVDDRLTVSVAGVIGIGGGSLTLNAGERLVAVLGLLLFCVGWAPERGGGRVDSFVDGFHSAGAGLVVLESTCLWRFNRS